MNQKFRHRTAIFFALLFMAIASAPTVILLMDDSADVTFFYGENEEEKENLKLLFQIPFIDSENQANAKSKRESDVYAFKKYPKPHLNLIFPPPEHI
ncbi:MAG: hypothetical protein EVB11_04275 [Winogradskyella sp.]|nr:MAG: hypothetical protein EVB11_04275 [Winogradskyella sp.]